MLKQIDDETILKIVMEARLTEAATKDVKLWLPLWMVQKLSKKRKITEDERSEILVRILEQYARIWELSLAYSTSCVLGFFVTYVLNLFRNLTRSSVQNTENIQFLKLWSEGIGKDPNEKQSPFVRSIHKGLHVLPQFAQLILSLKYHLDLSPHAKTLLLWKLKSNGMDLMEFQKILLRRAEIRRIEKQKMMGHILRYTRLLYYYPESEKRNWYLLQKKSWIRKWNQANNRSFFSERELVKLLGVSRKSIRTEVLRAIRFLKIRNRDLLHCA